VGGGQAVPSLTSDACEQGQSRWASVVAGFDGELCGECQWWVGGHVVMELMFPIPPARMD
jgi:hypothetical protein